MNNNTMNNNYNSYNNDHGITTMSDHLDSSSGILVAEAVQSTSAQQHQPGTASALYQLAARNLREYHGVPSMTALELEKTLALLGLPPGRLVMRGIAPRRLLKGGQDGSSLVLAGEISDESMDDNPYFNTDNQSSKDDDEEEEVGQEDNLASDDSNSTYDDYGDRIDNTSDESNGKADGDGNNRAGRPIHAALVAGGINLRPRETRPLLRALGVSPHRLVKLGLVTREAVRAMPGRGAGGPRQSPRGSGPRQVGVRGPRGPPRGPPHAPGCGPWSGCGSPRPLPGRPRRPFHGHHTMHLGWESEEEGMSAPLGPHAGPGRRGPHHLSLIHI